MGERAGFFFLSWIFPKMGLDGAIGESQWRNLLSEHPGIPAISSAFPHGGRSSM
jgi:hypothetical protein